MLAAEFAIFRCICLASCTTARTDRQTHGRGHQESVLEWLPSVAFSICLQDPNQANVLTWNPCSAHVCDVFCARGIRAHCHFFVCERREEWRLPLVAHLRQILLCTGQGSTKGEQKNIETPWNTRQLCTCTWDIFLVHKRTNTTCSLPIYVVLFATRLSA